MVCWNMFTTRSGIKKMKNEVKIDENQVTEPCNASEYEAPTITTFTSEELMETLGPAQGYGGSSRPGPQNRTGLGRGHRLFPGIR